MRIILYILSLALCLGGCGENEGIVVELARFPVDSMERLIYPTNAVLDKEVSADGHGSLRVSEIQPATVRLYETGDLDIDNCRLLYRAKLRTRDVKGQVYLEMLCSFPGKGEFFSRAIHTPLSGNTDWHTQETMFLLKKGENPDNIKCNVVINGTGTVWIDDISLIQERL